MVGDDGRLGVVGVFRDEVAIDAGAVLPLRLLVGRRAGRRGLLGLRRGGAQDEKHRESEPGARLHPPSAIVRATTAVPMATIARPVHQGWKPENFASL